MRLSRKCHYALRALFELAKHRGQESVSIADIGEAQEIPGPFLQAILRELRQGGFVESRRGKRGGYHLSRAPEAISIAEVIQYIEGDIADSETTATGTPEAFEAVWREIAQRIHAVCENISLKDLLERARMRKQEGTRDFVI